jgi:hypothetical protein
MYSGMGLCTVEKIGTPDFQPKGSQYYFLRQADDRSRIYVPVDTRLPMRKPITGPEAERFLEALSAEVINWGSNIPHRDLKQIISEYPRSGTCTYDGSGSALFFTYFVENRKSRSFISADFCPLLDFDWVEHSIFFNNQINLALDFDGLSILFDLFLVAAPVIGHTITIINSSVGIGL